MGFFQRLFGRPTNEIRSNHLNTKNSEKISETSEWEKLPAFIPADAEDIEHVSVIATAIAAGDRPDIQFVVKKVLQRNPEVKMVSIIAASIAAGDRGDSQLLVKNIYQKKK